MGVKIMEQLDLLWELQKHDEKLKKIKEKLEELAKKGHIENMTIKIQNLELKLENRKKSIDESDKKLIKNSETLRDLNFQLDEIEKELYSGTITDLKQLDYMDKESKNIRKDINDIEMEIISLIEEIENFKIDMGKIEVEYENIKEEFKRYAEEYKMITDELRQNAKEEIDYIYEISSKLEKGIYEKYKNIKNNKEKVMAEIIGDECSGCHMILPTYLINKVKENHEIVQCENCGRILYFVDNSQKLPLQ